MTDLQHSGSAPAQTPAAATASSAPPPDAGLCLVGTWGSRLTADFVRAAQHLGIRRVVVIYIAQASLVRTIWASLLHSDFSSVWNVVATTFAPQFEVVHAEKSTDAGLANIFLERKGATFFVCGCDRILTEQQLKAGHFINYHNSILPEFRGVAAVAWSRFSNAQTGFTIHEVTPAIDQGRYILQEQVHLPEDCDAYYASRAIDRSAASQLGRILDLVATNSFVELDVSSAEERGSYRSRKDFRETIAIDDDTSEVIEAKVRAFGKVKLTVGNKSVWLRGAQLDGGAKPAFRLGYICVRNRQGVQIQVPALLNPSFVAALLESALQGRTSTAYRSLEAPPAVKPAPRIVDRIPYVTRRTINHARSALDIELNHIQPWNWERTLLTAPESGRQVLYIGTHARRLELSKLIGAWLEAHPSATPSGAVSDTTAVMSELPAPGAITVPWQLSARVDLAGSFDDVSSSFSPRVLRKAERRWADFRVRQVTQLEEALAINRTMLEPFAARWGEATRHVPEKAVLRIALSESGGGLFVLEEQGVAVGCNLSLTYRERGRQIFEGLRLGYIEAVFSDPRRLSDVNTASVYCIIKEAWTRGFSCYDHGPVAADPRNGQLRWKCERGGRLSLLGNYGHFHLNLPRVGAADFLWDAPLFSEVRGRLGLELGLPAEKSDAEVIAHYSDLHPRGIQFVRVHCTRPLDPKLEDALREKFAAEIQANQVL